MRGNEPPSPFMALALPFWLSAESIWFFILVEILGPMLPLAFYLNATIINKTVKVLATGLSNGNNSNNTPNTVSGMSTSRGGSRIPCRRGCQWFCQNVPKTAWNWENFGPWGGGHVLGHPLGSATDKECCKTAPPHLSPWIPTTPRPPWAPHPYTPRLLTPPTPHKPLHPLDSHPLHPLADFVQALIPIHVQDHLVLSNSIR